MEREFIEGTGGKSDYLIIAQNGKVRIGLKPIVENLSGSSSGLTIIGFRLRSVPMPGEQCTENELTGAWPNIAFHAISVVRASTTVGGVVDTQRVATSELLLSWVLEQDVSKDYARSIAEFIGAENLKFSEEQIGEFMRETFLKIASVNDMENGFDQAAIQKGANVIDLQAAALLKGLDKSKLN